MIIAIDPGSEESALCVMDGTDILHKEKLKNQDLLVILEHQHFANSIMAIEMIASYGMPVGREVFQTCVWIGKFEQAHKGVVQYVYRQQVKLHICKSPKANDATIRRALIDRFGAPGTKKNPGKLYGFSKDLWSALAVGLTALECKATE